MTAPSEPRPGTPLRPVVDCTIVGGGPVGLLTAVFLGRAGLRVAVVERWPQRYPLPRACTIDHEALRILQAAGLMADHADLFEPSQGERGGYEFRNGEGELLQAIDWNRTAESGWANTNGFHQPDLEAALEALAAATPGVSVHRGWTFRSLDQDGEGVSAQLAPTGQPDEVAEVRSRWLIGADGANSAVRTHLGTGVDDSGFQADWLVVDYRPLAEEKWSAFVTQYCDPAQPATAVSSGPGRRRFEFMRPAGMTAEELGRESTAWRLMAPWGVTPQTARLERHAVYTFRGAVGAELARGERLPRGRRGPPHAALPRPGAVRGTAGRPGADLAAGHGAPRAGGAGRARHVRSGTRRTRPGDHRRGRRRRPGHLRTRPRTGGRPGRRDEEAGA
ncbi:hypothetical protein GCM10020295_77860 [Streptomyces cinereospinus]